MKILFVIPYSPATPTFGGALRIYHILKQVCKKHDVTVTGFCKPGEVQDLERQIPELRGKVHCIDEPYSTPHLRWKLVSSLFSRHSHWYMGIQSIQLQQMVDRILAEDKFDVIHCEFPAMAYFSFNGDAKKVIDCHNVEYDNFRRMSKINRDLIRKLYYRYESYKIRREELAVCSRQDAIFTTSKRDRELFDEDIPEVPKFVIPNGVDLEYFQSGETKPEEHALVFVGMMGYTPNYDGITYFLDKIFPRITSKVPDAKIYIVGKNPPASIVNRASSKVIVTGFVDDIRPYVHRSSVYVVPLRMGGGTRLKIIEAFAMKKPIVTTSIGCEGLDVKNGEHLLIADQPDRFAKSVIELMRDDKFADQLITEGYKLASRQYGWNTIGDRLDEAYTFLCEENRTSKNTGTNSERKSHVPLMKPT